jgi:hypothetical protein
MTGLMERLDDIPRPAWIALVVVSFIVFWPVGLALLIYLKWSGRMFCSRHGRYGHWSGPDGRSAGREARDEFRAWRRRHRWGGYDGSGNVAFDADLEGQDPDRLVGFEFDPPMVSVNPGGAGFSKVRVKPARTFWRGTPKTRNYKVAVKPRAEVEHPAVRRLDVALEVLSGFDVEIEALIWCQRVRHGGKSGQRSAVSIENVQ